MTVAAFDVLDWARAHDPAADGRRDNRLSLSSRLVRFRWDGAPAVAVRAGVAPKVRLDAVVDALAWYFDVATPTDDTEEPDDPPTDLKRQSPNKAFRRFLCDGCNREFSVDIYSAKWIECRRCLTDAGLRPICRGCKKPVDKVASEAWRCRNCADIRDIARRAAGSGETPTGALHDRRGRAQRPRP